MPRYIQISEGKSLKIHCLSTIKVKSKVVWFYHRYPKLPLNTLPMTGMKQVLTIDKIKSNHTGYYFCFGGMPKDYFWARARLTVTGKYNLFY